MRARTIFIIYRYNLNTLFISKIKESSIKLNYAI